MTVSVVIPAYNEEKYISGVLAPLQGIEAIREVIVVSDGSTDNTVSEAKKWNVAIINIEHNIGKGGAMYAGFKAAKEDYILFLDADLIGLKREHILSLILPVINDEADMTLGIFGQGRIKTDLAQIIAPSLTGQRCINKKWFYDFKTWADAGFGVETALTYFAMQKGIRIKNVNLPEMTHITKEEKYGFVRGFAYRLKMYWEIMKKVRTGV
ncbi:MAG: glycosyl transferase family 2 [Firmicutes bacterium HGW-Firmicutes-12]|jgi:glycosyltransferase involved in cell wall biosynthesis|nr:MAG: glycosyl transferase family 2 [Firmicutes bacterium HGW-Firmicutes-12]